MKKIFSIILFLLLFNISFAQRLLTANLVVNPSFEFYTQCPDGMTQITYAYPWSDCLGGGGHLIIIIIVHQTNISLFLSVFNIQEQEMLWLE